MLESHLINPIFLVVTCDTTAIPAVDNAHHVLNIRKREDGLNLPGEVTITYSCNKGYSLDELEEVVVGCIYNVNNRSGADGQKAERIVTAEWEDTSNISCKISKWLALVVDKIYAVGMASSSKSIGIITLQTIMIIAICLSYIHKLSSNLAQSPSSEL